MKNGIRQVDNCILNQITTDVAVIDIKFQAYAFKFLQCLFRLSHRSRLFASRLVYTKAKLIMRILLIRRNKYVMQSTALTNKINDSNKVQKNREKMQTKLTYIVFGILCRHS